MIRCLVFEAVTNDDDDENEEDDGRARAVCLVGGRILFMQVGGSISTCDAQQSTTNDH